MKRALCIWLPNWPLQRLAATRGELRDRAVLLYQLHSSGGAKVTAFCPRLDRAAWALWSNEAGNDELRNTRRAIRPGMPLAEATVMLSLVESSGRQTEAPEGRTHATGQRGRASASASTPTVHLELADPSADRLALEELATWCHTFGPSVSIEDAAQPESLLLDVTGLGPLFGGEGVLVQHVIEQFAERHLLVRVALADTLTAAWGIAHFAPVTAMRSTQASSPRVRIHSKEAAPPCPVRFSPLVIPPDETADSLFPLSPAALGLPPDTCDVLSQLGLARIGQLAVLPRESLLARFGPLVLRRLDQAMGQAAEAIVAEPAPPEWQFDWPFEHPTSKLEAVAAALDQLLARLCEAMARERRGVLRLECRFAYEQQTAERLVLGLFRPSANAKHLGELLQLKLEGWRFREPVAGVSVRVLAFDQLEFRQQELLADATSRERDSPRELAGLVDRLSNRLGPQAVLHPWLLADAQPEFACQYRPVSSLKAHRRETSRRTAQARKPAKRSRRRPASNSSSASMSDEPLLQSAAHAEAVPPPLRTDRPVFLEPCPRRLAVLAVAPEGPPVRFRLADAEEQVTRTWGPERIETGWWRGRCVRRDYYQVETVTGSRYWLFRELNTGAWFLHGTFG